MLEQWVLSCPDRRDPGVTGRRAGTDLWNAATGLLAVEEERTELVRSGQPDRRLAGEDTRQHAGRVTERPGRDHDVT